MRARFLIIIAIVAAAFAGTSCSQQRGAVVLTITAISPTSSPFGDIITKDGTIPSDTVDISLFNDLKNEDSIANQVYSNIQLEAVTVTFTRNDGGKDVPQSFRYAVAFIVPTEGSLTISDFPLIPATMKTQFPISDLLTYGYERSTNYTSEKMNITLEITGKTVSGDPVYVKGSISIEFANWAD